MLRAALFLELHRIIRGAEAQPGKGVDDDTQALMADERFVPAGGLVAIEVAQEIVIRRRGENRLDLARKPDRVRRRPRWKKPGVNEQEPAILHHQRAPSQPVEQL